MYEGMLCTCCMSTEHLTDLFTTRMVNGIEENYGKMLCVLNIQVTPEDGHDSICMGCVFKLRNCIAFKRQALRSISILTSVKLTDLVSNAEDLKTLGLDQSKDDEVLNDETKGEILHEDSKDLSQISNEVKKEKCDLENGNGEEEPPTAIASKRKLKRKAEGPPTSVASIIKVKRKVGRPRKHPKGHVPYKIGKDELRCRECGEEFPNNITLKVHYNSHFRNHVCEVCDKGFMTFSSLRKHQTSHLQGPFPCKVCGRVFNNMNTLHSHTRLKHSGGGFRCDACGARFATYSRRLAHAAAAHGPGRYRYQYRCGHCDMVFRYSGARSKHIARQHVTETSSCPQCPYRARREYVRAHMRRRHGIGRPRAAVERARVRRFICKLCNKGFAKKVTLQYHIGTHIRRGEYSGSKDYLIYIKDDDGSKNMGLLEGTTEEEYLDESLLSDDLDLGLDEDTLQMLDEDWVDISE